VNIVAALRSGRRLIMDGAMGTELLRRGYYGPSWRANLETPALVRTIHDEYRSAGACVLLTNTFLAAEAPSEGLRAGLRLAREAAAGAWIVASLGPAPRPAAIVAAASVLADADAILLETWSDRSVFELARALDPAPPLLVSFTFRRAAGGVPVAFDGTTAAELARLAQSAGVAALGVNCGRDQSPEDSATVMREYRTASELPLFARPNAGSPIEIDGSWQYPLTAEEWARRTARITEATMLGGCCGTTPDHIACLARASKVYADTANGNG
jgi:methionine synthase I (cobalamin-dependent)